MSKKTLAILLIVAIGESIAGSIPQSEQEWKNFFNSRKSGSIKINQQSNYQDNYNKSSENASNSIETFKNYGTGKTNINNNLAKPIQSNTKMKTVDGKKEFNATLKCKKGENVITVSFVPLSNNEYRMIIKQDLDIDSKVDNIVDTDSLGVRISGVCSNGFVYCNPYNSYGDLNNPNSCRFFYFSADSSGKISIQEDTSKEWINTGSCICSNASCGYQNTVLYKPIVGGIMATFQSSQSRVSLDEGKWDLSTLTYYIGGTDTKECKSESKDTYYTENYGKTGKSPEDYYNTKTYPNDALSYVATTYDANATKNTKQSPYTLAMKSQNPKINGQTVEMDGQFSCVVRNNLNFTNQIYEKIEVVLGTVGDNYWSGSCTKYTQSGTFTIYDTKAVRNLKITKAIFDDWIKITINDQIAWVGPYGGDRLEVVNDRVQYGPNSYGSCELGTNWNLNPNVDVSNMVKVGENTFKIEVIVSGSGEGYAYLTGEEAQEDVSLITDDGCKNYANDASCKLKEEEVCDYYGKNCTKTISNFRKVATASRVCNTIDSSIKSYIACADGNSIRYKGATDPRIDATINLGSNGYFYIKREYFCEKSIDKSLFNRSKEIVKNSSLTDENPPTLNYDGKQATLKQVDMCPIAYCMVRTNLEQADVFADKTVRADKNRKTLESRVCNKSSGSWICPVSQGEEIVDNCSCDDSSDRAGMEAIATLNAIEQAVKDMICGIVE